MRNAGFMLGLVLVVLGAIGLWVFDDRTFFALAIWAQLVGLVLAGVSVSPRHLT